MLRQVEHEKFKFLPEFNARSEEKNPKNPTDPTERQTLRITCFILERNAFKMRHILRLTGLDVEHRKNRLFSCSSEAAQQTSQTTSACSDSIFIGGAGA